MRDSLRSDSTLLPATRRGMQALKNNDVGRIRAEPPQLIADSLALDDALRKAQPNSPRWDYVLGVRRTEHCLIGVEVHGARDAEVKIMIEKKRVAEQTLKSHLSPGRVVQHWFWISTGSTTPTTVRSKQLSATGISLVGSTLRLPADLKRLP